jgi:hypothetical protein
MYLSRVNAEAVDLRHFAQVKMSDAFDGRATCHDGDTWYLLIYKNRVVAKKYAIRNGGSVEQRTVTNQSWWQMYTVSQVYRDIMKIARYKYFDGQVSAEEDINITNSNWDIIVIEPEILKVLETHPQYLSLVKNFALKLQASAKGFRVVVNANHFDNK